MALAGGHTGHLGDYLHRRGAGYHALCGGWQRGFTAADWPVVPGNI